MMTQTNEAEIRAVWAKLLVHTAKTLREPARSKVLSAIEPLRATIRDTTSIGWLPAAVHADLADRVAAAIGRSSARELWSRVIALAFDGRMLAPIVHSALRMYGRTPGNILRATPQAYTLIMKRCGHSKLHATDRENAVRLQFTGVPPVIMNSDAALDMYGGNCDGAIAFLNMTGTSTLVVDDAASGRFHYLVEWDPPG